MPAGFNASDLRVGSDGTVMAGTKKLGQIQLVEVPAPDHLQSTGTSNLLATSASGAPVAVTASHIKQGALEESNVDLAKDMALMVTTQRDYQLASTAIQTGSQMMSIANDLRPPRDPRQRPARRGTPDRSQAHEPAWVRDGCSRSNRTTRPPSASKGARRTADTLDDRAPAGSAPKAAKKPARKAPPRLAAGSGELSSMLPQALASGVMSAGGLGLAAQMTQQMQAASPGTSPKLSGGTAA